MALRDYADIIVSFEAQTVTRAGFGTLLFLTEDTTEAAGTVTPVFGSLSEVEDFGYATDSEPYKAAAAAFAAGADQGFSRLKIAHKSDTASTPTDWVESIGTAEETDSDWYALAIESRDAAVINDVADNIQARDKQFFGVTNEPGVLDAQDDTDVASSLLSRALGKISIVYHEQADTEYLDMAWLAYRLPSQPGTVSWDAIELPGITQNDFSSGEVAALRAKRCNYYATVAGGGYTYGGFTSQPGMYMDIVRGIAWLQQRMQEDYVAYKRSVDRIPYVGGGAIIESEVVRRRLDIAVDRGVIADNYTVTVPRWQDQDPTDRAERHYPGIEFDATYVGAVNTVQVSGIVRP